jgi:hypothetical protein
MSYQARERQVFAKMFTFFSSKFFKFFNSTMASNLESVVETPKTVTEVYVHGTFDGQPVKAHKSKNDCLKAGRASMIPPVIDSLSKRASLNFAANAPPLLPAPPPWAGRNASCSSTFLGKNQRLPSFHKGDQEPTKEATG